MRASEFEQARSTQPKERLKSLYSRGNFGPEFTEAAREELPYLWGRMSLLEEFYDANAPGLGERSHLLHEQLGRPIDIKRGILARLRMLLS